MPYAIDMSYLIDMPYQIIVVLIFVSEMKISIIKSTKKEHWVTELKYGKVSLFWSKRVFRYKV